MSWHFTKVSKIENGARSPSEEDIRTWCTACGASDQIPDLIATVRHIEAMYHEYRRQMQAGLKHVRSQARPANSSSTYVNIVARLLLASSASFVGQVLSGRKLNTMRRAAVEGRHE